MISPYFGTDDPRRLRFLNWVENAPVRPRQAGGGSNLAAAVRNVGALGSVPGSLPSSLDEFSLSQTGEENGRNRTWINLVGLLWHIV